MKQFVICFFVYALSACQATDTKRYKVSSVPDNAVVVDGVADEAVWHQARHITSFTNPWSSDSFPETRLSLVRDEEQLYFYFDVKDEEVVLVSDFGGERDVEKEDRVELFFSKDQDMEEYYCFEIDAEGRVLSYSASHYRQLDFSWNVPQGFNVVGKTVPGGYVVEGAIPLEFLNQLADQDRLFFGAYRAEFARKDTLLVENWLTWVDPETAEPDFHVPSSLGKLVLK